MIHNYYRVRVDMGADVTLILLRPSKYADIYETEVAQAVCRSSASGHKFWPVLEEWADFDDESLAWRCQAALQGIRSKYLEIALNWDQIVLDDIQIAATEGEEA